MIYNQIINDKNINIKKKLKYSEKCTLIPIKYNNNDLIIQTPKLYIPFGEKFVYNNNKKKYIDISFQNINNDNNIQLFYDNLLLIYNKINNFYNGYNLDDIIKKYNKNELLRLKMSKDILIYDQNKKVINEIIKNTYGNFIIHLQGLWLINNKLHFDWILLQGKIDMPLYLSEYAFIDENTSKDNECYKDKGKGKGKGKGKCIPPPPPNNYNKLLKLGISMEAINHKMKMERTTINPKDLLNISLKKTVIVKKVTKENELLLELKQFLKEKNKV